MIYAILLDVYQREVSDDDYAVTFSGALDECRDESSHDGHFETWLKSDFRVDSSEPCTLGNSSGGEDQGRILGLEPAYGFVGLAKKFAIPVAIGIATGFVAARFASSRGYRK